MMGMDAPMVALVTGANRGVGLEVCRQLARKGYRTILAARDRRKGERAANGLVEPGGELAVVELDVTSHASIAHAASEVRERFDHVDVLVNNAAILVAEYQSVLDLSPEDLRATFETNVFGAVAVTQAFVPGMIKRKYGRIVNVSSAVGQMSNMSGYAPAYAMSKVALNAFTRQLAVETKGTGVLVNSACPGWVRTGMGGASAPRSVEEGADTIVWLATAPPNSATGCFFKDRREISW
jgi:NAD(P)-dependent dehydrogenase (short-subunit alcohol dehydrogenase family)